MTARQQPSPAALTLGAALRLGRVHVSRLLNGTQGGHRAMVRAFLTHCAVPDSQRAGILARSIDPRTVHSGPWLPLSNSQQAGRRLSDVACPASRKLGAAKVVVPGWGTSRTLAGTHLVLVLGEHAVLAGQDVGLH